MATEGLDADTIARETDPIAREDELLRKRRARRAFSRRERPSHGSGPAAGSAPVAEGRVPEEATVRAGHLRRALAAVDAATCALVLQVLVPLFADRPGVAATVGAMVLIVFLSKTCGLYDRDDVVLNKSTLDEVPKLIQLAAVLTLLVWVYVDATTLVELQIRAGAAILLGSFALLVAGRLAGRLVVGRLSPPERCLVIGDAASIATVRQKLDSTRLNAMVVGAVTVDGGDSYSHDDLLALFRHHVRRFDVHRVIIAPGSGMGPDTMEMLRVAKHSGVHVSLLPRMIEVIGSTVEFDHVDGLTLLGVRRFGLSRSSRLVKRGFDLVGSGLLLLAAAPVFLVISLIVRFDPSAPGPALFRQTRVGKDGEQFEMLKFRSMEVDAEERKESLRRLNSVEGLFKLPDDPRVTRVGGLLRRTSLDELPQLLNVWRGEMSLVGPRPLVVDEDRLVQGLDRHRLHLTPGMTGNWQILGSARVPLGEMVGIDYLYVANWSLWSDVKILLRTIPHMLASRGM
jgi:exopolysaccharide biosynthesis polyprenyl glycosylphosphotransferase